VEQRSGEVVDWFVEFVRKREVGEGGWEAKKFGVEKGTKSKSGERGEGSRHWKVERVTKREEGKRRG
jgi:hypothetical protein